MSFTGLGGAIGSIFGADDLEERFNQAIDQLKAFQATAEKSLEGFRQKGQLSFDQAFKQLTNPDMADDTRELRKFLTTEIASGLSPFAKLQFEDLNKVLEGAAVKSGNLRSGAIGIQRAELGRRIASDEFGRALQTLDKIQTADIASAGTFLQGAVNFGNTEVGALNAVGNAVGAVAGATIGLGQVEYQKNVAMGTAAGMGADMAASAAAGYAGGGTSGFTGMLNKLGGK